jgi:hypothetical protein
MSETTIRVVNFSELVNDDNRFPAWIAGKVRAKMQPPRFLTKERNLALLSVKKIFDSKEDVEKNFDVVLSTISRLPVDTHFSVGSLFSCADKSTALYLGKKVAKEAQTNPNFKFMTGHTGKWIYFRTGMNPELVDDFKVSVPFVL